MYARLIRNHTMRGELIMDCFAGSGTCTVAALIAGRNVMAIEPDQRQIDGISARLEDVQLQLQTVDEDGKFLEVTPETLDSGQRAGPILDKIANRVLRKQNAAIREERLKAKEQRIALKAKKQEEEAAAEAEEGRRLREREEEAAAEEETETAAAAAATEAAEEATASAAAEHRECKKKKLQQQLLLQNKRKKESSMRNAKRPS